MESFGRETRGVIARGAGEYEEGEEEYGEYAEEGVRDSRPALDDSKLFMDTRLTSADAMHIITYLCWRMLWMDTAGLERHRHFVERDLLIDAVASARMWQDLTHAPAIDRDLLRAIVVEQLYLGTGIIQMRALPSCGKVVAIMGDHYGEAIGEVLTAFVDFDDPRTAVVRRITLPDPRMRFLPPGTPARLQRTKTMVTLWFHPLVTKAHLGWITGFAPDPLQIANAPSGAPPDATRPSPSSSSSSSSKKKEPTP
jgi:hypothetical protein